MLLMSAFGIFCERQFMSMCLGLSACLRLFANGLTSHWSWGLSAVSLLGSFIAIFCSLLG
jgi:hypothetical protein